MTKSLWYLVFLGLVAMLIAAAVACSSDSGGGDDDSGGDDDAADCTPVDNPIPSAQCSSFCSDTTCGVAVQCGFESTLAQCSSDCLIQCQKGCMGLDQVDCFTNFTDCDTLNSCLGINK
jgi:hypothetical protein